MCAAASGGICCISESIFTAPLRGGGDRRGTGDMYIATRKSSYVHTVSDCWPLLLLIPAPLIGRRFELDLAKSDSDHSLRNCPPQFRGRLFASPYFLQVPACQPIVISRYASNGPSRPHLTRVYTHSITAMITLEKKVRFFFFV